MLQLVQHPDPRLNQVSAAVPEDDFGSALEATSVAMQEVMRVEGGVGLAGVQVGDMRRILLADVGLGGATFFANPVITEHGRAVPSGFKEGCLSYPRLKVNVHRYSWISLTWQDVTGEAQSMRFEGYAAIVLQHEMDHLDGLTIFQKAFPTARRKFGGRVARVKKARQGRR